MDMLNLDTVNTSDSTTIQTLEPKTPNDLNQADLCQTTSDVTAETIPIEEFPKKEPINNAPPDGGLTAWLTVFACFVSHMICFGPEYSYGIFTTYYLDRGLGSSSAISIVGSLGAASVNVIGIFTTILMSKYGFQRMVLIGASLYFMGFLLASFCESSLVLLALTQALLYGFGASFAYYPALAAPNQWFSKKRGIALGLGVAGSGVGGVIYSIGTQQLLDSVGFQWTMRITAMFSFVCLCAVVPFVKERTVQSQQQQAADSSNTARKTEFTAFRSPLFNVMLVCILFFCLAFYIPTYYLPDYAVTVLGIDVTIASYLLTAHNGSAVLGRIVIGFIADMLFGRVNTLIVVIFTHSFSTIIWACSANIGILYAFTAINGFASGAFWVVFPVVVAEFFGVEKLGGLVGILYTMNSFGALLGPSISGAFRDHVTYTALIAFCGILTFISGLFAVIARVMFVGWDWRKI